MSSEKTNKKKYKRMSKMPSQFSPHHLTQLFPQFLEVFGSGKI